MRHHDRQLADPFGAVLSQGLIPFMAGLVFGGALLAYLRHRRLRWTWALGTVPFAYGSWLVSWRAGLVLGVGGATAIVGGVRLHLESLGRGGEEARAARHAIGPLVVLRSLIAERGARRQPRKGTTLAIGRTARGSVCRVPIGRPGEGRHVLTVGATGGGKTVSQASIVAAHIDAGMAAVVVDPKGDSRLRATLRASAAAAGVRFREWSPSGSAIYNPIANGNPDEIADKALAAHEWSEPHYEMATRRLLGLTLATMQAAGLWPPTLCGLVDHSHPERLDVLADRAGGKVARRVRAYVDGLDGSARSDLRGGRDRLAILAEGELGRRLDPTLGGGEEIDLRRALDRREVVYFRVDADRYPLAARLLGAALVIDLASLAAGRQGAPTAAVVLMDEFGSLAAAQVSRLLARCRGAGISLVLGTQSLADLRAVGSGEDTLTEQVIANVGYTIAHRIADPDSAERLARMAGTEPDWTRTEQLAPGVFSSSVGASTRTRERDFVVGPDAFKRLPQGRAVVINPTATPPAEIVQIWAPEVTSAGSRERERSVGIHPPIVAAGGRPASPGCAEAPCGPSLRSGFRSPAPPQIWLLWMPARNSLMNWRRRSEFGADPERHVAFGPQRHKRGLRDQAPSQNGEPVTSYRDGPPETEGVKWPPCPTCTLRVAVGSAHPQTGAPIIVGATHQILVVSP